MWPVVWDWGISCQVKLDQDIKKKKKDALVIFSTNKAAQFVCWGSESHAM